MQSETCRSGLTYLLAKEAGFNRPREFESLRLRNRCPSLELEQSMAKKLTKSKKNFLSEREGQMQFFADLRIDADVELTHNTDGVYKGTLFEFKLTIPDINRALFQAIKYLSHKRIKGEPIPAQILLVALNEQNGYLFYSGDFLPDIEKIYAGAASKNNADFNTKIKPGNIDYSKISGLQRIIEILSRESFTKINIDVFDVVGWANHYYSVNSKASKSRLFEELRSPKIFKDYIYPWKGKDIDFKYINDLLNAKILKKELGAFYTPVPYCRKATELVRQAIKRLPPGHDYIILDRSAGTGNLEEFLTDKKVDDITVSELDQYIDRDLRVKYLQSKADIFATFYPNRFNDVTVGELEKYNTKISLYNYLSDNEISHTIVNTYELKEWIVLNERLGDKVKLIIPPPIQANPKNALVSGGDALSDDFVLSSKVAKKSISNEYFSIINQLNGYIADKKINIILFENPPFRDETSNSHMNGKSSSTFIKEKMKEEVKGSALNDLSNQFIWSGWKYYLKKPDDYFILFSPIKYWKSAELSNKKFVEGFIFNRRHFHNNASAITCILWKNENENRETIKLNIWDIKDILLDNSSNGVITDENKEVEVKKVRHPLSRFYDKRDCKDDLVDGIICALDGTEDNDKKGRVIRKYNKNIIGYLVAQQFGFENPRLSTNLTRCAIYNGNGFFLRSDNFIEKLPLFAAGKLPIEKTWWLSGIIFKTSDGGERFKKDTNFLKACFLFTCLSYFNKCRSLNGTDGRFYKNELCFDKATLASEKLKNYKLTIEERDLLGIFKEVLRKAKTTKGYNSKYTYGTYQIDQELNTRNKNDNEEWIYDYPELNTELNTLKTKLLKYYESVIQPKLFEYELLK